MLLPLLIMLRQVLLSPLSLLLLLLPRSTHADYYLIRGSVYVLVFLVAETDVYMVHRGCFLADVQSAQKLRTEQRLGSIGA